MFDSEDWHAFVRQQLVEFESLNSSLMQSYCDGNISDHISRVKYLTVWGTHVELVAAASLLQMPIYVCTQKCGMKRTLYYMPYTLYLYILLKNLVYLDNTYLLIVFS